MGVQEGLGCDPEVPHPDHGPAATLSRPCHTVLQTVSPDTHAALEMLPPDLHSAPTPGPSPPLSI